MTDVMTNPPLSLTRMASALRYLDALDEIEGWLCPTTALAMIEVLWEQERLGAVGDIAEIGIWRGKSFLALAAGARPGERLVAVDPFDAGDSLAQRPDLDVAPYGTGYKAKFLENLACFFPGVQPDVIEASSAALDQSAFGSLRVLSIDGNHSREQTFSDLRLAAACLTEQGVCWLDDVFNGAWPGVISGLFAYLDSASSLQPVALFPNKLVLVRPGTAQAWRDRLRVLFGWATERQGVELHNFHIDVYRDVGSDFAPAFRLTDPPSRRASAQRVLEADAALSACQTHLLAAEQRALEAEQRVLDAEAALSACKASTSWRLTSPLRGLATALRR